MPINYAKMEQDHRKRMVSMVNTVQEGLPDKWKVVGTYAIGGLTSVGFSQDEQHLLVVSSQGRGVFDCWTGRKVARDNEADGDWLDERHLRCQGIGPIVQEFVPIAGLAGGGLRRCNDDGDLLECIAP